MKILVLTGSPRKRGTSSHLTDKFIEGALESGHSVTRFDTAFMDIHPCIACDKCEGGKNPCVFKDDMSKIYPVMKESDMVVLATPTYYHGMSSQIRTCIDRFHGIDHLIRGTGKKTILLTTAADTRPWVTQGLVGTYEASNLYLQWHDCGRVIAQGCYQLEQLLKTDYPEQAYQLGKSL